MAEIHKLNFYYRGNRLGQIEKTEEGYIFTPKPGADLLVFNPEAGRFGSIPSELLSFLSNKSESSELFPAFKKTIESIKSVLPRILLRADKYLRQPEFDRLLKEALELWGIYPDTSEWDTLVKFAEKMKDGDSLTLQVNHIEYYVKPADYLPATETKHRTAIVTTDDGKVETWVVK